MSDVGYLAALLGGVLALLSPCSAMLLPAFFAYAFGSRRRLVSRTGVFYLGLALLPPFAGFVRDLTGLPAAPLLTAAGFLAVCLTALGIYASAMRRQKAM